MSIPSMDAEHDAPGIARRNAPGNATYVRTDALTKSSPQPPGEDVPSSDARELRDPNPSASRRQAALDAARRDLIAAAAKLREDGARRSRLDVAATAYRRAVDDNGAATKSKP